MEKLQFEQGVNEKAELKPKRRNSIDKFQEVVPLKHMKLVDVRTFNNKITKLMVPYTYSYDGSVKTMKISKNGNRRMSEWNIENRNDNSVNVDAVNTLRKSNIENESHNDGHVHDVVINETNDAVKFITVVQSQADNASKDVDHSVDINKTNNSGKFIGVAHFQPDVTNEDADNNVDVDKTNDSGKFISDAYSQGGDELNLIDDNILELPIDIETHSEAPLKTKPANIRYRRKSARLSMSRDRLGSYLETSQMENKEDDSNNSETQAEANRIRNSEKQPRNISDNVVPSVQAETNKCLYGEKQPQNSIRGSAFQLLARSGGDDSVKLWQTKNNSISDPLFYCFDLVEKTNANTIKVSCLLCDPKNDPLTCKVGSHSNLKAHLNRVLYFNRACIFFSSIKKKI